MKHARETVCKFEREETKRLPVQYERRMKSAQSGSGWQRERRGGSAEGPKGAIRGRRKEGGGGGGGSVERFVPSVN